jgi:hypothetical protein
MKFSKLIIGIGAAAVILASATPALASAMPRLRAIPNTVDQGGSFALKAEYPRHDWAIVTSKLLPHPIRLHAGHGPHYALVNVGPSVTPGVYELTLRCFPVMRNWRTMQSAQMTGWDRKSCRARAWVTVLKYISPTPPPKKGHHYLRSHGKKPEVIINTGLGGLANVVSQHHPASS